MPAGGGRPSDDLAKLQVAELRKRLAGHNLPTKGKKAELLQRLRAATKEAPAAAAPPGRRGAKRAAGDGVDAPEADGSAAPAARAGGEEEDAQLRAAIDFYTELEDRPAPLPGVLPARPQKRGPGSPGRAAARAPGTEPPAALSPAAMSQLLGPATAPPMTAAGAGDEATSGGGGGDGGGGGTPFFFGTETFDRFSVFGRDAMRAAAAAAQAAGT
eukprot:SAG22_NODE_325_length_12333_cov_263.779222_3_plen_215_part_00